MTAHNCKALTDGCFRCDLNRDELESARQGALADADVAWHKWLETPQDERPQSFYSTEDVFKAGFMASEMR